jgi:hypothetical protein
MDGLGNVAEIQKVVAILVIGQEVTRWQFVQRGFRLAMSDGIGR